jgi:hypothetical protein
MQQFTGRERDGGTGISHAGMVPARFGCDKASNVRRFVQLARQFFFNS